MTAVSGSIINRPLSAGSLLYPYGGDEPINMPFFFFTFSAVRTFFEISFAYISLNTALNGVISLTVFSLYVSIPSFTAMYRTLC